VKANPIPGLHSSKGQSSDNSRDSGPRPPHLLQKSAREVDIQGRSKGGTTSSSARLVSTAAGPFIKKLTKLHRAKAAMQEQGVSTKTGQGKDTSGQGSIILLCGVAVPPTACLQRDLLHLTYLAATTNQGFCSTLV
jgi:hypothetical protein